MDYPPKATVAEADMVPVRMFGQKATFTKDGIQVTAYLYNGKIYVDDVKVIGPRLVKPDPERSQENIMTKLTEAIAGVNRYQEGSTDLISDTHLNCLIKAASQAEAWLDTAILLQVHLSNLLAVYSEPDRQMCCDGRMCGCQGSTVYDEAEHYARAALVDAARILPVPTLPGEPT